MRDLYDTEKELEAAIVNHDAECDGGNALLVGWVLVSEWIDKDGNPNLVSYAKEGSPYWRVEGLLQMGNLGFTYIPEDE